MLPIFELPQELCALIFAQLALPDRVRINISPEGEALVTYEWQHHKPAWTEEEADAFDKAKKSIKTTLEKAGKQHIVDQAPKARVSALWPLQKFDTWADVVEAVDLSSLQEEKQLDIIASLAIYRAGIAKIKSRREGLKAIVNLLCCNRETSRILRAYIARTIPHNIEIIKDRGVIEHPYVYDNELLGALESFEYTSFLYDCDGVAALEPQLSPHLCCIKQMVNLTSLTFDV